MITRDRLRKSRTRKDSQREETERRKSQAEIFQRLVAKAREEAAAGQTTA
jgi:hypothetical protein